MPARAVVPGPGLLAGAVQPRQENIESPAFPCSTGWLHQGDLIPPVPGQAWLCQHSWLLAITGEMSLAVLSPVPKHKRLRTAGNPEAGIRISLICWQLC